jgi:hypothetical protein
MLAEIVGVNRLINYVIATSYSPRIVVFWAVTLCRRLVVAVYKCFGGM